MKRYRLLFLIALWPSMVQRTFEQTPTKTESALPRLVRFGGTVKSLDGSPPVGVVGITFALYSEQTGGAPLWLENQNVSADSNGRYNVLLGSTKPDGLPADLFTSEQAHWVGVQVEGQPEQPRVLLVSAPYALKAGDAETIGGLPPSAFVLAGPPAGAPAPASASPSIAARTDLAPAIATDVTTTGGTANYLPFFTGASTVLDSVVYQSGTGSTAKIGINTSAPIATLDVVGSGIIQGRLSLPPMGAATAGAGINSYPFDLFASVYNSSTSAAVMQTFQLQAEPVGNDTAAPSGALSLLYGSGAGAATETGLKIASNGVITFAGGQTFPGTGPGSITGVTAGADLTGGGTTGNVTLNLDTTKVPQLAVANTFTANQTVNGSVTAASFSGNGSGLTSLQGANVQGAVATAANAIDLGGLPSSAYQPAGSYATTGANTFTGDQNVTGNVIATASVSGAAATFTGLVTEAGALLPPSGTATAAQGYNSQPVDSVASAYNSGTGSAQNQDFQWLAEPVGNNSISPSGKLDLLFGSDGAIPVETGLSVAGNGVITFASGQTFPGAAGSGTVTSVGSGAGLTGGPITSSGILSIATGGVSNSMLANPSLTVLAGTDLTGGGSAALGGSVTLNVDTTKVPQLGAANTFTANQTVNGIVTATSFSGNGSGLTNLPGATAIPCVGAPGNTTGAYLQQCQTTAGAVYACKNSAGCAVASDWVTGVTSISGTSSQICASAGTGAVLLSICNPFTVTVPFTVNNATNRLVGSTITINGENDQGVSSPFVLGNAGWDSTAVPYVRPAIANQGNGSTFYVIPNGNTTTAWMEIFSTDLFADAIDFESLSLLKYPNGPGSVSTNSAGTGLVRSLIIQDPAYAPGGQTCVACSVPATGMTLDIGGNTRSQGTLWAYTNAIVGPNTNIPFDTLNLAPTPSAGAIIGQLHLWNSANTSGTGSSIDFTNANSFSSISTQIVSVANFASSTGYGCGGDASNSHDLIFKNTEAGVAKQILTLCGDQNIEIGGTTPNPGAALTVASGDVYITSPSSGVIMKDTATGTCYRLQMTSGALVPTALGSCPTF